MINKLNKAQHDEFTSPLYNLLVLDVDGCLLNREKKISEANKEAISFLKRRGVYIILASGRGSHSLRQFCNELDLKGRHVSCHGASIFDASNNVEEQLDILTQKDMNIIMRKLNEFNVIWVAFGRNKYYCNKRHYEKVKSSLADRKDIEEDALDILFGIQDELTYVFPEEEKINKVLCYVKVDERGKISELSESLSNQFIVMMSTDETFEIIDKKTSKKKAVQKIIEKYAPQNLRKIVVGDYDNDIDILKWGDQAVAPSNASMGVRKVKGVNILETSNDEDLIWEIARAYFNLRGIKSNNGT
jgi:Cof subfamily protein (haloacid dehalogenase superfamily)